MNNITRLFAAALLSVGALSAQAAPVYECIQNGQRVYTQNPGGNCQKADIGRVGLYSSSPAPAVQPQTPAQENRPENRAADSNQTQRQAARQQLEQAQKALEDGKQVRYGNERNYVRYQQRIQSLEAAVSDAQQKLDALDKTDESAPEAFR
ncbi:lipoic acid synthetase [Neisseria dentiae]|uniref:lipoic acid synthetase n=1 Tax=Neisseria dentiae TaxID=194197 RepID=UPI0035A005AD